MFSHCQKFRWIDRTPLYLETSDVMKANITSSGHVSLPLGTVPPVVDSLISLLGGFTVVSLIPQLLRQFGRRLVLANLPTKDGYGWIMIYKSQINDTLWHTHTHNSNVSLCEHFTLASTNNSLLIVLNGFIDKAITCIYPSLLPSDPLITQMEVTVHHFHP